jgi:hypothetical protein
MRSWKTTLIGALAGVSIVLQATLQQALAGQHVDWNKVGLGCLIALLGYVCKDYNVTGSPSTGGKDSGTK